VARRGAPQKFRVRGGANTGGNFNARVRLASADRLVNCSPDEPFEHKYRIGVFGTCRGYPNRISSPLYCGAEEMHDD
jgi:hypothetical protein